MTQEMYLATYVRSFFEDYLVCRRNVSYNTIQSYRDSLKLFLNFAADRLGKSAVRLLVSDIAEGVVIFNTTIQCRQIYQGGRWVDLRGFPWEVERWAQ